MIPGAPLYDAGVIIKWNREWGALLWSSDTLMHYVVYAIDHGISIQDASGVTFQDFIVAILLYRKDSLMRTSRNLKGILRSSMILNYPAFPQMHILFARWSYTHNHRCIRLWVWPLGFSLAFSKCSSYQKWKYERGIREYLYEISIVWVNARSFKLVLLLLSRRRDWSARLSTLAACAPFTLGACHTQLACHPETKSWP